MVESRTVQLDDGRAGEIVRIETAFPQQQTVVSVWTGEGPGVARVSPKDIVGPARSA